MRNLLLCLLLGLLSWPVQGDAPSSRNGLHLVASIEPVAMVLRELLHGLPEDEVRVSTLLAPNQNMHHVSFTPGQARALRQADLVVWLGAEAEPQVGALVRRHGQADLALTDLPGIYRRDGDEGHVHEHDGHHHHHDSLLDPHLWLYPDNMLRLAQALAAHPVVADLPDWPARLARFDARLAAAVQEAERTLAPHRGQPYLSHHDAWAYFADAFQISRPLIITHNVEASASSRRFAELYRSMQQDGVRCVMAEPEGRRSLLERLCGEDCQLVEADPLGRDLGGADYSVLLTHLATRFSGCLAGP